MTENAEINKNQVRILSIIHIFCALGFLGTIPNLLLGTTELAYMVGEWYINFLFITSLLIWVCLAGIWNMKKLAVFAYSIITIITQIVLIKYNVLWSYTSLIIPALVVVTIWLYFNKMK